VTSNTDTDRLAPPSLPEPRGPLSETVIALLRERVPARPVVIGAHDADAFGEDLQLALYVCYELHYQGFGEADPEWEWDPDLLRLRGGLERRFLSALRAAVPGGADTRAALRRVAGDASEGASGYLRDEGDWWQLREYLVHRSIYHLKEADPHAWLIPRLRGRAKAALVAVEFDEYGGGRSERMHSRLFADLLEDAGLDSRYGRYLDAVPAVTLAIVNMMSLFGLHRSLRGAMVGHFAAAEISTPPSAQRMTEILERLGAGPRCALFFTEHIEADAVHEQVLRHDVIGDLLASEPRLAEDVVLGVQATELLEGRLGDHLVSRWRAGESSLRTGSPPYVTA
jgi:Iron-containing redox enzyme